MNKNGAQTPTIEDPRFRMGVSTVFTVLTLLSLPLGYLLSPFDRPTSPEGIQALVFGLLIGGPLVLSVVALISSAIYFAKWRRIQYVMEFLIVAAFAAWYLTHVEAP